MPEAVGKDTTSDLASQYELAFSSIQDEMDDFIAMAEALNDMLCSVLEEGAPYKHHVYGISVLQKTVMHQFHTTWGKAKTQHKQVPNAMRFLVGVRERQTVVREQLYADLSRWVADTMREAGRDLPGDDPKAWLDEVQADHTHHTVRLWNALIDRIGSPGDNPSFEHAVITVLCSDLLLELRPDLRPVPAEDDPETKRVVERLSEPAASPNKSPKKKAG